MRTNIVKCLPEETKQEIRDKFQNEDVTKTALANAYDISVRTLGRILKEEYQQCEEDVVTNYNLVMTETSITISCGCDTRVALKSSPSFKEVKRVLVEGDFDNHSLAQGFEILNVKRFVEIFTEGNITVDHENSTMWYGSFKVEHYLADVVFKSLSDGKEIKPLVKFIDSLMKNPKENVVQELYEFLKHNCIEINNDGSIKAYKGITRDYLDKYTQTIDNSVGEVVQMPRTKVNDNPNQTCSQGLHVGAIEYATSWGDIVVETKVWPSDVVSVPTDYNGQKMRCCKYEVVAEC